MAMVLGQSGRYVTDEAMRQRNRYVVFGMVIIGFLGVVMGIILSKYFVTDWLSGLTRLAMVLTLLFSALTLNRWGLRKAEAIEKKRDQLLRGASGEILVGQIVARFPDDFWVINDLSTPQGNIDHVVVGPTGIYLLDAKTWRGVVTPDGKGELTVNGRPADRQYIRHFAERVLWTREKVARLTPDLTLQFNPLFVFTSAWVDAKWGTTGVVNCIRHNQLYDCIVGAKYGKKLSGEEISRLAQAFLALANLDKESGRPAAAAPGGGN